MKRFIYIVSLVVLIGTLMTSCVKEKSFSPIPVIVFKQFILYNIDSADCIIGFKDGDGDIGILTGDTISPDDLKMKYLYKLKTSDPTFLPYNANPQLAGFDTLFYGYRVPDITPDGQYKALDGEIKIKLRTVPLFNPADKVVKFQIVLTDRAGHKSNMVETNEIIVP